MLSIGHEVFSAIRGLYLIFFYLMVYFSFWSIIRSKEIPYKFDWALLSQFALYSPHKKVWWTIKKLIDLWKR